MRELYWPFDMMIVRLKEGMQGVIVFVFELGIWIIWTVLWISRYQYHFNSRSCHHSIDIDTIKYRVVSIAIVSCNTLLLSIGSGTCASCARMRTNEALNLQAQGLAWSATGEIE